MGHRWADIQNYTVTQMKDFAKAAARFYERQGAAHVQYTAIAAQGDSKTIESTVNKLLEGN